MYSIASVPQYAVAEDREDLLERRGLAAGQAVGRELAIEVPDGEPVVREVELGEERRRLGLERVEVRVQVPPDAVHVDELVHPHDLE